MANRLRIVPFMLVLVLLCTLVMPQTSRAEITGPLTEAQAVELLRSYGIVKGDPSGNLGLSDRLTRAQAAAVFVRSMGAADLGPILADLVPFSDAKGHWGAGEIAAAERMGLMRGDPDGNFRPDSNITYAEVLTVLLRMVKREPSGAWNPDVIYAVAEDLGMAPKGVDSRSPAIRGKIFWSLGTAVSRIPLESGKNLLQTHLDSQPPHLAVQAVPATTLESQVTITGTARDAVEVKVNGQNAKLNAATGQFEYTASLQIGENQLRVEAVDWAGNKVESTVTVERLGAVARLEVTGPTVLRTGASVKLTVKGYDSRGNEVPVANLTHSMSGGVATFDPATLTLKTGSDTGRGVLTLRAGNERATFTFDVGATSSEGHQLKIAEINGGHAPGVAKDVTVKVQVLDEDGKLVTDDYWRQITLSISGLSGASIVDRTIDTVAGVAAFTVRSTAEGTATITATASGLLEDSREVQFLRGTRVVLTTTTSSLKPDGASTATIKAQLEDENGETMRNNTDSDIIVDVESSGTDGELTSSTIVIRRGATVSSTNASFRAGIRTGTALFTGTTTSSHKYPVQSVSIPVVQDSSGLKLQVVGPSSNQAPGSWATFQVKVVNSSGQTVTSGSYAFQLKVSTSNNDPVVDGLPEGLDIVLSGTQYRPVVNADGDSVVIGRTYQGTASLKVKYEKSGVVTITPQPTDATYDGYHNSAGPGVAVSSLGMSVVADEITFAGDPSKIILTADSPLGNDLPGAAATGTRTITIRARVVDSNGVRIPGNRSEITLTRTAGDGISKFSSTTAASYRKTAVDGEAEFTIQTTNTAGYDLYTASAGKLTQGTIVVSVRKTAAETPIIAVIRGVKENHPSPTNGYIAPDDDYMEIQLEPQAPVNPGEPTHWVTAKVYRKGSSTPIYSGAAVDLNAYAPVIRVPKSKVPTGTYTFEVSVNNGFGETAKSPDLGASTAVNAVYNTKYKLNSAQYDAETGKLVISSSSLPSNGTLNLEKISLVSGDAELSLDDPTVEVVAISSSQVTLKLGDLAEQITPDEFSGDVYLEALDGWIASDDGAQIAKANTQVQVKPMGLIASATLDLPNKRLTLNGRGLAPSGGTISLNLIQIGNGTESVALRPGTSLDRVISSKDSQLVITLSQATADALEALDGPELYVTAETGWLKTGSGSATFKNSPIEGTGHPVFIQVSVTSAAYDKNTNALTLKGKGLTGATISPARLQFEYARMTGPDWAPPSNTPVTIVSDTELKLQFDAATAQSFETKFGGRNVYMNTLDGWFTDSRGRSASALSGNSIVFYVSK